jgi:hypothetical protein
LTSTDSLPPINEEPPSATTRNIVPSVANDAVTERNAAPAGTTGAPVPSYAILAAIAVSGVAILAVTMLIRKRQRGK